MRRMKAVEEKLSRRLGEKGICNLPDWLDNQVSKGRISEILVSRVKVMAKVLQEVYPGNWDLRPVVKIEENYNAKIAKISDIVKIKSFYLVVRFPEIIISNSKGRTHQIRDIFIEINVDYGGTFKDMWGYRGTMTEAEYLTGYRHSHLARDPTTPFNKYIFCLGSSPIPNLILDCTRDFNEVTFTMLVLQLDTYIRWESLDGGPHIRMAYITNTIVEDDVSSVIPMLDRSTSRDTGNLILKILSDEVIKGFEEHLNYIKWRTVDGEYKVIVNDEYEQYIYRLYVKGNPDYSNFYLVKKTIEGNYYPIVTTNFVSIQEKKKAFVPTTIPFRNTPIETKVLWEEVKEEIKPVEVSLLPQIYVHPDILNYVTRKLEEGCKQQQPREILNQWLNA